MLLTLLLIFCFLTGWNHAIPQAAAPAPLIIEGRTMGTTYRIIYFDRDRRDFSSSVDSLLLQVNKGISNYDPDSDISRFNRSEQGICIQSIHLYRVLKVAKEVYRLSDGAFDPTVMPLVNAWGFGPGESRSLTAKEVDSLRTNIGFDKVRLSRERVLKRSADIQLDMGGIGQGYGADVISEFLASKGIEHMLVELGGEGVAMGRNLEKNKPWTIGILDPGSTPLNQFFKAYVSLTDQAFTTSGNYFNYKVVDGRKFGHTIDPKSGYPVQHTLLSASVFTGDAVVADAWATAFMVMGTEKAIATARSLGDVSVLLIYGNEHGEQATYVSPDLEKNVTLE